MNICNAAWRGCQLEQLAARQGCRSPPLQQARAWAARKPERAFGFATLGLLLRAQPVAQMGTWHHHHPPEAGMGGGGGMSECRFSLHGESVRAAPRLRTHASRPLPGMAGNHPNNYLLGFSAALAPKFPPREAQGGHRVTQGGPGRHREKPKEPQKGPGKPREATE